MNNIRLSIDGLEFDETQEKVRTQLEGVVGVVETSFRAGQDYVDINYDDQTSAFEINNHLQNNGYKITDGI